MNLCLEFYFPVTQARVLSAMFSVRAPFPRCGPDSVPERASPEGQNSEDMIVFSQMPPVRHTGLPGTASLAGQRQPVPLLSWWRVQLAIKANRSIAKCASTFYFDK